MKVFLTGASGYLGTAIGRRLVEAGFRVQGLIRRAERAEAVRTLGVTPVLGVLEQPETYLAELKNCDAVVHAARSTQDAVRTDQTALETIRAAALDGRVRHVVYTSAAFVHGPTGDGTEDESARLAPATAFSWRPAHEDVALDLGDHDVHVSVMRPGMVYGGGGGLFGSWFREAHQRHTITYPGDGHQRWNPVHCDDLADAYRLALEHVQGAQKFLLVDESHFAVRELAEAAARVCGAQAQPLEPGEVIRQLGEFGESLLTDRKLTAAKARRELGWVPRHVSFVAEAEAIHREWLEARQTALA